MTLTFEIPDATWQATGLSKAQAQAGIMKEVALALYRPGLLSAGKAAEVSGVTRLEFEDILAERHIERPYDMPELERDLAWAKRAD